jgi:monoterpene epsilon-lactone hydrolase
MPSLRSRLFKLLVRRMNFLFQITGDLAETRRRTDLAAKLLPIPRGVSVRPAESGGIPGEWIVPKGAPFGRVLLYIHGGGFVFCSTATHRALVARLAIASGIRAFSMDYRLAPEHPFPAALDDCLAAYRGLREGGIEPGGIVVAGDSAGGNLALTLLLALRRAGEPLPAAAVCLSPVTDLAFTGESARAKVGIDPIFPAGASSPMASSIRSDYVASGDPYHELISPLYADWRGLPPILLHVGEDEILLDDSVRVAEKARSAGGQAELVVWRGMWHVFQVFAPFLPEAEQSIRQIGKFIREALPRNP